MADDGSSWLTGDQGDLPIGLLDAEPRAAPSVGQGFEHNGDAVANAEAQMMERWKQILTGPNRNIFADMEIKEQLIKPVEVLNRANTGRFNAKKLLNSSDKERLAELKQQMMQKKSIITAWLLKRQSMLSRFKDTRLGKFVFAKFVLKKPVHFNPVMEDIANAFASLTQFDKSNINTVIAHYAKIQLSIVEGMPEFLQNHRSYVERMERLCARAAAADGVEHTSSITEVITVKRLAYNVLLDCLATQFQDFKFDVVIDHDDQMAHYDIQHINGRAAANRDDPDHAEAIRSQAQRQLDGILDIVGQNGGNREAVMVDIFNGEADDWDPGSFVRDLINATRATETEVGAIATENDATAILMHYMCEPNRFDPNKTATIIQARINKQWYRRIQAAKNGDELSARLLTKLRPPPGLMSYRQAITEIAKHYEGDEKFELEAAESGVTEGVMPFPVIVEYAMLNDHLEMLGREGRQGTQEYNDTMQAMHELCPPENHQDMQPYLEQYHTTRETFEQVGVDHEQFANPSMLEPGSAIHCFPDNCQDSQDAALVSTFVVAYLDLVESLHRTEEAMNSGSSLVATSVEDLTQKMVDMIQGPSVEDLHQNDMSYFEKHYDAPWVGQVEDNLKTDLYRLAQTQASIIREQQERDVANTWEAIQRANFAISEADIPVLRTKIELAFQRKPEDYIVEGHTQTLGTDGRTQKITLQYISPDVKNNIKASKINEKTPIKWSIIASALWKVVCECAENSSQRLHDVGSWNDLVPLSQNNLLKAVFQVLNDHYLKRFICQLAADMKTSAAAEERASALPKRSKKRKRALMLDADDDEGAEQADGGEPLKEIAKKGKLIVTSGATQKKKPTLFVP